MMLFVDGIVYETQRYGGIGTYFNSVLPRIARQRGMFVKMFVPSVTRGELPAAPVQRLRRNWVTSEAQYNSGFEKLFCSWSERINRRMMSLRIPRRRDCIFQSTYFTSLAESVPQIAVVHDLNHEIFPEYYLTPFGEWLRNAYKAYLRDATRIIAVSNKTKLDTVRYYGIDSSKIDVIYHAIDRDVFFHEDNPERLSRILEAAGAIRPYFLYVGRRGAYKNFETLLRAYQTSRVRGRATLLAVGPPWSQDEKVRLRNMGLGEFVRVIEHPSDDDLRLLYSGSCAFVFPSYGEGFGLPLLEAMACGAPILAADIEVFREVAGDSALYFDPASAGDLSYKLTCMLDDSIRRAKTLLGYERAAEFSWNKCAALTIRTYEAALREFW